MPERRYSADELALLPQAEADDPCPGRAYRMARDHRRLAVIVSAHVVGYSRLIGRSAFVER